MAKVIPVYKNQGNELDKQNYRPISILPILSKIYERHIHDSLYMHLLSNELLYGLQSGFRRCHSAETALVRINQILFNLDKNNITGLLCTEYSKAFDLMNHEILLVKLKAFGVVDNNLSLFHSYLSDRQYVFVNGCKSSPSNITYGIPQGIILGPLLFIAFINDLPSVIFYSTVDTYADYTTFSISFHCLQGTTVVQNNLQQDIDSLCEWPKQSQMVLKPRKTVWLLITGKRLKSRIDGQTIQLQADSTSIEHVRSNKLLGVIIDEKLNFKTHVDKTLQEVEPEDWPIE